MLVKMFTKLIFTRDAIYCDKALQNKHCLWHKPCLYTFPVLLYHLHHRDKPPKEMRNSSVLTHECQMSSSFLKNSRIPVSPPALLIRPATFMMSHYFIKWPHTSTPWTLCTLIKSEWFEIGENLIHFLWLISVILPIFF